MVINNMKYKINFLLVFLGLIFFSCNPKQEKVSANDTKIIEIDTKYFLSNVASLSNGQLSYIGDKPAIIDFYATWCGSCRQQTPILEKLSKKYADSIYIYKVDVDESPDLANIFNVSVIPTLVFLPLSPNTPIVNQGLMQEKQIEHYITNFLLK